jgi:hypothetical protein
MVNAANSGEMQSADLFHISIAHLMCHLTRVSQRAAAQSEFTLAFAGVRRHAEPIITHSRGAT